MSRLKAPAVAPQSVLVARASASLTRSCLADFASPWVLSSWAKWTRRALSKELRAWLNRCQSAPSVSRSSRAPAALVLLPLLEQLAHPGAAALPLDLVLGLAGDLLGLGHDGLALGRGHRAGGVALGGLGLLAGGDGLGDLGDLGLEHGEVADDVGLGRVLAELGQSLGRVLGGQVGGRDALVQQVGRGEQLVVLAGEVVQRLLGGGARVGAHLLLALLGAHEDGAVLGDPAERLGGRAARRGSGQGRLAGGPPCGPRPAWARPRLGHGAWLCRGSCRSGVAGASATGASASGASRHGSLGSRRLAGRSGASGASERGPRSLGCGSRLGLGPLGRLPRLPALGCRGLLDRGLGAAEPRVRR